MSLWNHVYVMSIVVFEIQEHSLGYAIRQNFDCQIKHKHQSLYIHQY